MNNEVLTLGLKNLHRLPELFISYLRYVSYLKISLKAGFRVCFIQANTRLSSPSKIRLGSFSRICHNVEILGRNFKYMRLGDYSSIGPYSRIHLSNIISANKSYLSIGHHTQISAWSSLGCAGGVTIGNNCLIGEGLFLHSENHKFSDPHSLIKDQGVSQKGIMIGSNCWFGSRVTILDGVSIGDHCVIAAGSVVTKSFSSRLLIAGNPAKVIRCI